MAHSTLEGFFKIPFMNETIELDCKRACVKLKRYESTIDNRAWSSDEAKQSKFLSDLLTCQSKTDRGDNNNFGTIVSASKSRNITKYESKIRADKLKKFEDATVTGNVKAKKQSEYHDSLAAGSKTPKDLDFQFGKLTGNDSLLECANIKLTEYQKILNIKTKELEVSNEHLKTAEEENKKIREIVENKLDSNATKEFYNKIQKFTALGKLNKNEENEMLRIYERMEHMNKSYEILQATNYYLKRLVEKLKSFAALDHIKIEPEQSTDVSHLQNEINRLRKECHLLKQIENDYQSFSKDHMKLNEKDIENIKRIMTERNSLKRKCESFKSVEQQLKKQAQEAKKEAQDLLSSSTDKILYINKMEAEMQAMQKYYDEKIRKASFREESLKAQLEEMKDELIKGKRDAQKANILVAEVSCLRNEVLKRDTELNEYDCQYKQLMDVVNELQSVKVQSLHDNETQTCQDASEELTFYTCATLEEIIKELKKKSCSDDEVPTAYGMELEPGDTNDNHCCQEMKRLQYEIDELQKQILEAANCEAVCADAVKRLHELETINAELSAEKQNLTEKLKDSDEKIVNILKKMENLDLEINRNGQETSKIGEDLQGALGLVKDISEVQLKNQQLANAVSTINSRDDQKIIDDLKRQLVEEQDKLKMCQKDNAKLIEVARVLEAELNLSKENEKLKNKQKDKANTDGSKTSFKLPQGSAKNKNISDKSPKKIDNYEEDKQLSEDATYEQQGTSQQKSKSLKNTAHLNSLRHASEKDAVLSEFVSNKSDTLKLNLLQGHSFEKEFRKILDDFILDCSFCFCRLFNTKSKLYAISHKLSHSGIGTLSFRELAYLHKKIYAQADQLLPGCLLDMILSDHKEQVERMLVDNRICSFQISQANINDLDNKCCCCKNELCCDNSEEMLKEKVNKLEKDIEVAREYLETLKHIPIETCKTTDDDNSSDSNNSTYRAAAPVTIPPKSHSKHLRKLKSHAIKNRNI